MPTMHSSCCYIGQASFEVRGGGGWIHPTIPNKSPRTSDNYAGPPLFRIYKLHQRSMPSSCAHTHAQKQTHRHTRTHVRTTPLFRNVWEGIESTFSQLALSKESFRERFGPRIIQR
uniref:Uncharacterized protein n=1 Tax=Scophthalmus maximus TaxID=52904 RepID=A0A8D3DJ45_SCOMX